MRREMPRFLASVFEILSCYVTVASFGDHARLKETSRKAQSNVGRWRYEKVRQK
jgi:hypothetical protein